MPPSYNFIFTIDYRFLIHIRIWWWSSHYLISCKSFILEEFTSKLRYLRRNIVMHKYTLHFETARLRLIPWKESLVHKIAIISTVQFNSIINFEWFILSHYHLLVAFFSQQACLNWIKSILCPIQCHLSFISENYFGKVNFHIFPGPILML